jgi:hypothetical protein
MAVWNALDEGMQPQATQIVAHPALGVMGGVETQQLSQQGAHERLACRLNNTRTLNSACHVYLRSATPKPVPLPASIGRAQGRLAGLSI